MIELEELLGEAAFLCLCDWAGGSDYYVPHSTLTDQGRYLVQQIGETAAQKLIAWGKGTPVYIPLLHQVQILKRRDDLLFLRSLGKTIDEITREFRYEGRYSNRQVRSLLSMPASLVMNSAEQMLLL